MEKGKNVMSDEDLKVSVGIIEAHLEYIRESIDDIKENYSTKSSTKLAIKDAMEKHEDKSHKNGVMSNRLVIGGILLALMGGGGAVGNIATELLMKSQ